MASGAVTGRQILERWGMLPYELIEIILAGKLVAVNTLTGEKHSRDNDNCFFCTRDMGRYYSPCNARRAILAWNNVEGTCSNNMRAEYRNKRLAELEFLEREVLAYEQDHGLRSAPTLPTSTTEPGHDQQLEEIDPKDFAERELAQGKAPGQVMLALAELYDDMPKWKAAGLALRRTVVDLNEFERDKLKSRFYDRTKKFKQ